MIAEKVLKDVKDSNPFKKVVQELRDEGLSWNEIYDKLDQVYIVVGRKAVEESTVDMPQYLVQYVNGDGEIKDHQVVAEDVDKAEEWVLEVKTVSKLVETKQIGTVEVVK